MNKMQASQICPGRSLTGGKRTLRPMSSSAVIHGLQSGLQLLSRQLPNTSYRSLSFMPDSFDSIFSKGSGLMNKVAAFWLSKDVNVSMNQLDT
ncbi:unnamed protein product [Larinioides sclopetarius]|uniref:Uncharacterized protein n=1 Tax=Larinioides sclopetarius TaxID=280406 RepID=A0AAV2BT03_9ARAC